MTYMCVVVLHQFHQKCPYAVLHWFHQKFVCRLSHWNIEIDCKQFTISQNDLHLHRSIPVHSPEVFSLVHVLKYKNRLWTIHDLRMTYTYTLVLHWFHQKAFHLFLHWNSEIDYKHFTISQNHLRIHGSIPIISPEVFTGSRAETVE